MFSTKNVPHSASVPPIAGNISDKIPSLPQVRLHPSLAERGIKVATAIVVVPSVSRNRGAALKEYIEQSLRVLQVEDSLKTPIFEAYHELHVAAGFPDAVAPAQRLLQLVQRTGNLPTINRIVDTYNIASVETLISIGAHDLSQIQGDIRFDWTTGKESYWALGEGASVVLPAHEYACLDNEKVLCRLDIRQCHETLVNKDTRYIFLYTQGNRLTSQQEVDDALEHTLTLLKQFCEADLLQLHPRFLV